MEDVVVSVDVLRVLCDTTVRLTEIRQRECSHLCVENFASECLANLLHTYANPSPDRKEPHRRTP